MSIAELISKHRIEHLVHFTTTINLLGIYEYGSIIPRSAFDKLREEDGVRYSEDYLDHMDSQRFDGLMDYINLSVSHPNVYLLNSYKSRTNQLHYDWCVVLIDPVVMTQGGVLFSVCNAASKSAKTYKVKQGDKGFLDLFRDEVVSNGRTHNRKGLLKQYPTDVQAEVLVPGLIPIKYIQAICFEDKTALRQCKTAFLLEGHKSIVDKFCVRSDLFVHR